MELEPPSEWHQLLQAYVVIAIGILAVIVMFDSKARRDHENRLALVLGYQPAKLNTAAVQQHARELRSDVRKSVGLEGFGATAPMFSW